jgi:hypothetical protein
MLASVLQRRATSVGTQHGEAFVFQESLEEIYDISGAMGDQNQGERR